MYTLKVDLKKCDKCGKCEVHLFSLLNNLKDGKLLISDDNYYSQEQIIEAAVNACSLDCITVECDIKYEYKCSACKTFSDSCSGAAVIACPECHQQTAKRIS